MKRRVIAAVWIAGATLPLLAAALLVVGCCVLPFHQTVHKVVPACHLAASVMGGGAAEDDAQPSAPAREKEEPTQRIATTVTRTFRLIDTPVALDFVTPASRTAYRSFIAFGALRCDRDIGLHVLVRTLLI